VGIQNEIAAGVAEAVQMLGQAEKYDNVTFEVKLLGSCICICLSCFLENPRFVYKGKREMEPCQLSVLYHIWHVIWFGCWKNTTALMP
jgi:hypothetical protein